MARLRWIITFLLLIPTPSLAEDLVLPAGVTQQVSLQELGQAELTYLIFKPYDGILWVSQKPWSMNRPFALGLHYKMNFSRKELVDKSIENMQALEPMSAEAEIRYRDDLNRVFPDVSSGDRIVAFFNPPSTVQFYHNEKLYGEVSDADFARPFFGIWLHEASETGEFRQQLLGLADSGG